MRLWSKDAAQRIFQFGYCQSALEPTARRSFSLTVGPLGEVNCREPPESHSQQRPFPHGCCPRSRVALFCPAFALEDLGRPHIDLTWNNALAEPLAITFATAHEWLCLMQR